MPTANQPTTPPADPRRRQFHEHIRHAFKTLSRLHRLTFLLYYEDGLTPREIAAVLGDSLEFTQARIDTLRHIVDQGLERFRNTPSPSPPPPPAE
ncbi:MAG: hypothetical protein AAF593_00250 [Planctomycetota bacterium]